PRVGGGTLRRWRGTPTAVGPSPRGRGNRLERLDRPIPLGAIPAWAGEPWSGQACPADRRGHPRVGGGTLRRWRGTPTAVGPSPRGRGNRYSEQWAAPRIRAIPAWAGE